MTTETKAPETLLTALLAVQGEAPALQKDRINPAFKAKYVTLDKLMSEVLPILNRNGLAWVTMPVTRPEGTVLRYRLIHAATSQEMEGEMPLLMGKRDDAQALGSAITYARRYSLMAVLGLVANEDDDAKAASRPSKGAKDSGPRLLKDSEREKVMQAIEAAGNDEDGTLMILGAVGVESADELTTAHAFEIRKLLDGES